MQPKHSGYPTKQPGESYKAPNGQDVPSVITYVDETGGKTNYLSIRQISELLDASVGWNAATNSVDIAAPNAGKVAKRTMAASPPTPQSLYLELSTGRSLRSTQLRLLVNP